MSQDVNYNFIKAILSNTLFSPAINIFEPLLVIKPTTPVKQYFTLKPGQEYVAIRKKQVSGFIREMILSTDSKKVRWYAIWEIAGRRAQWSFTAEDLEYLGLTKWSNTYPYVVYDGTSTNPYTGSSDTVVTTLYEPDLWKAFFDGYVEGKIVNESDSNVKVYMAYVELYIIRPKYMNLLKQYFGKLTE